MQSLVLLSLLFDDFKVSILTEEVSRFLPDTIRNASKWKGVSFGDGTDIVFFRFSSISPCVILNIQGTNL